MIKTKSKPLGMVDISSKETTVRIAIATGSIKFSAKAFKLLMEQGSPKGDVMEAARLAGIMAAKRTPDILPLCHPLLLGKISVDIRPNASTKSVWVTAEVKCEGKTGVEMESLTAVSAALLCIYDMMKWAGQDMMISDIALTYKSGGKSGVYKK